jgi:hypothetical protein
MFTQRLQNEESAALSALGKGIPAKGLMPFSAALNDQRRKHAEPQACLTAQTGWLHPRPMNGRRAIAIGLLIVAAIVFAGWLGVSHPRAWSTCLIQHCPE